MSGVCVFVCVCDLTLTLTPSSLSLSRSRSIDRSTVIANRIARSTLMCRNSTEPPEIKYDTLRLRCLRGALGLGTTTVGWATWQLGGLSVCRAGVRLRLSTRRGEISIDREVVRSTVRVVRSWVEIKIGQDSYYCRIKDPDRIRMGNNKHVCAIPPDSIYLSIYLIIIIIIILGNLGTFYLIDDAVLDRDVDCGCGISCMYVRNTLIHYPSDFISCQSKSRGREKKKKKKGV